MKLVGLTTEYLKAMRCKNNRWHRDRMTHPLKACPDCHSRGKFSLRYRHLL